MQLLVFTTVGGISFAIPGMQDEIFSSKDNLGHYALSRRETAVTNGAFIMAGVVAGVSLGVAAGGVGVAPRARRERAVKVSFWVSSLALSGLALVLYAAAKSSSSNNDDDDDGNDTNGDFDDAGSLGDGGGDSAVFWGGSSMRALSSPFSPSSSSSSSSALHMSKSSVFALLVTLMAIAGGGLLGFTGLALTMVVEAAAPVDHALSAGAVEWGLQLMGAVRRG